MTFTDGQTYQFSLNRYIEMLKFQIYAYEKSVEADHTGLIGYNLDAIATECDFIMNIIRDMKTDGNAVAGYYRMVEEKRANNG